MRILITDVDTAIGYALSKRLSENYVGYRRDDRSEGSSPEPELDEHGNEVPSTEREPYEIWATIAEGLEMIETERPLREDLIAIPGHCPKWVTKQVKIESAAIKEAILACDVIVIDLSRRDYCGSLIAAALEEVQSPDMNKRVISVSNVLTWGKTKRHPDDPDAVLTEEDYRRRKPWPTIKDAVTVEKSLIKMGKAPGVSAWCVCAGFLYHPGYGHFGMLLSNVWQGLPLWSLGAGKNYLPTIHLDDLVSILAEVVENPPRETHYILAMDESHNTQEEILTAIGTYLGTGDVQRKTMESAMLTPGFSMNLAETLQLDLNMQAGCIREMPIAWRYEGGIVDNIPQLVNEWKETHNIAPLKILLHAPPGAGKTFYGHQLADHYELPLLNPDQLVADGLAELERTIAGAESGSGPSAGGAFAADSEEMEAVRHQLFNHREAIKAHAGPGKYPAETVLHFLRAKLDTPNVRNQGYILDGYPTTVDEARELFADGGAREPVPLIAHPNPAIPADLNQSWMPDVVVAFDVKDSVIHSRIMAQPESALAGTRQTEDVLMKRLDEWRALNTDDNTILNWFDEMEIHPLIINLDSPTLRSTEVMQQLIKAIGVPHNFGPSREEIGKKRAALEEAARIEQARLAAEDVARQTEERVRQIKAQKEWTAKMKQVELQEEEVLEAHSAPLRQYLLHNVMPTLTQCLIEVCKVRPDDPVDYLADLLFAAGTGGSSEADADANAATAVTAGTHASSRHH